ncbi:Piwi domain-containing protein [Anabaena lutea]|uniref:Protein argonaute n=1 Tax=Anabaena lutea FACHB-196 TaxID=2692881 RepID=A0ABR8FJM3_9NOST|nr:Piwi domain-containing protein [Anabaena lutea]MBD2569139.1 stem cell self-renewal protein Piwi [Anabaena lutea FACHB-196]
MTAVVIQSPQKTNVSTIFLSELFLLNIPQPNLICFRLTPRVDTEIGNKLSWRFSQKFPDIIVIFAEGKFWVLAKPDQQMPSLDELRKALTEIQEELKKDIGDRYYSIQWVSQPQISADILSQLAIRILKVRRPFSYQSITFNNNVEVRREARFWSETIEIQNIPLPAIAITVRSPFVFKGNLAEFYENHPYRQNPRDLLIGLKVRDIEKGSSATIVDIEGTIEEREEELLKYKPASTSETAIREAPREQPVVVVQFGKDKKRYIYAMAALIPCITEETTERFDINFGDLKKETKIPYQDRQIILASYKQEAEPALKIYGFELSKKCLNSSKSSNGAELFLPLNFQLEDTQLLFGKDKSGQNFIGRRGDILKGLIRGGVYRRHPRYENQSMPIRITVLKVGDFQVRGSFIGELRQRLERYHFETLKIEPDQIKIVSISGLSNAEVRVQVEKNIDELVIIPSEIVLVFLPQTDRYADNNDDGSLYSFIYSRLLRRGIASQVIYEDTLNNPSNYGNILNQVIIGMLAKLGNLPYVLAEPLEIADYFIGLDVSRIAKKKTNGSRNACASVRLYDKRGEFIRYRIEDAFTEGEIIDKQTLEKFLPSTELSQKTVLIYRDGHFCGDEIKNLRERAKVIGSKFILVECVKSQIPRLYNFQQSVVKAPSKGLALRLSPYEVILVTTEVKSEKMGLPQPLRLRVIPDADQEQQVSIESLIEATLKLTLLHHGALKEPRLPVPLYGSDKIAYRRLQGIAPGTVDGDRQFWL